MTGLRETARAVGRGAVLPVLSQERLFAIEHVAARLDRRPAVVTRKAMPHAARGSEFETLSNNELRGALDKAWTGNIARGVPTAIVTAALERGRRSCDRAIIHCYLRHYPADHREFTILQDAAGIAAERHAWRWRTIGREYRLWDVAAAARSADGSRSAGEHDALLRKMGLVGRLADGRFAALQRS